MTFNSRSVTQVGPHYKWIALSNTTLSILLGFINSFSVLLALPVIFRGIGINPLASGSTSYLLWLLMGYMLVTAVFVVTCGRLGDIYGRTRMYTLGFAIFTIGALLCAITWSKGPAGAIELVLFRVVQGIGSAFLFANSAAILTDAFPPNQRGMALGLNAVAGTGGTFLGILVGGLLSQAGWRWVFLFNVPLGIVGTIWSYYTLREMGTRKKESIDWLGNITFGAGLTMLLIGAIYGINPSAHSSMSWTTPFVMGMLGGGILLLGAFFFIEQRVKMPMFQLALFRIRAYTIGNLAAFMGALARGGLMLMLTIWLQGIWLPLHGYDFSVTPLWSGICMIPSSVGMLLLGPLSGRLSDRHGARYFATGAMILTALGFALLLILPVDFKYPLFAAIIFLDGMSMGMFMSPNSAAIMNSLPPQHRGAGSGMRATIMNVGSPLSMAIIFSLMVVGLNSSMPSALYNGLIANGISAQVAQQVASAPPVGYLFAAFLGYNPLATMIPASVLNSLTAQQAANLTSRSYFPQLIENAFHKGLVEVLIFSIVVCLIGAAASWVRGGKYVYRDPVMEGELSQG